MGNQVRRIIRAASGFGFINSNDADYAKARAGTGTLSTGTTHGYVGQRLAGGVYYCYESFVRFDTSWVAAFLAAGATLEAANLMFSAKSKSGNSVIQARLFDCGSSMTSADWQDGTELAADTLLASYDTASGWTEYTWYTLANAGTALRDNINASGYTGVMFCSENQYNNTAPAGDEQVWFNGCVAHLFLEFSYEGKSFFYATSAENGHLQCSNATYETARSGAGTLTENHNSYTRIGQNLAASVYYIYEACIVFDTSSLGDSDTVTGVVLRAGYSAAAYGSGYSIIAYVRDWGGTLETGDFVAGADLAGLTKLAAIASSSTVASEYADFTSEAAFAAAISKTGNTLILLCTDKVEAGTAPAASEQWNPNYGVASPTNYPVFELEVQFSTVYDDDLDGSYRLMNYAADDDLTGSHRLLSYSDDDLDGSYQILGWSQDDLDGSYRLMNWAAADDLDGSHRIMVYVPDDDLTGSWLICGVDDLIGSHRLMNYADDDLAGSHRIMAWAPDDDLAGLYFIVEPGTPEARPKLLYVPQLSLIVGDSARVDLVDHGADLTSVRFGNNVIGGHGGASIEIPKRPAERVINDLRRGADARLYDAGNLLWQGVVKKVGGSDTGGGDSTTRVDFCGLLDMADADESFRWTWVEADYSAWQQLDTPAQPFWQWSRDAYYSEYWFSIQRYHDVPWDVRTDGELYLGTQRGYSYPGDAWYSVESRSLMPRCRLGARIDKLLPYWPSGSYDRLAGIKAIQFDWRANTGTKFRARVYRAPTLWCGVESEVAMFTETGNGVQSGDEEQLNVGGFGAVIVELSHQNSANTAAAGEFFQLLRVRLLVRPDGPGTRTWAPGDALPRLDQCLSDLLMDADGVLATEVDAEQIGDPLEHVKAEGPTRSEALAQVAAFDEDEDGTGQPLEYGIWDERRGVVRRRPADPDDERCWLAINTERDDVTVEVGYDDRADAPDYVEVRYQYLHSNLLRHSSPPEPGAWAARGYADDRPYDWTFTESGSGVITNVEEDSQQRWKMTVGAAAGEARMTFPKAGTYPVSAGPLTDYIPYLGDIPYRAAVWARYDGGNLGYAFMGYEANGSGRGTDSLYYSTNGLRFDDATWQRYIFDFRPEPSSGCNEMYFVMINGAEGSVYWRNACLYPLIPENTELSAWYPSEPTVAGAAVKTIDLGQPATVWQARNAAYRFWRSFRRGVGSGTISARGVLYDVRGREVPVSRIRGGWWASVVNDPRCKSPLYVSSVEIVPQTLEATLGIGGEPVPWSDRRRPAERQRFGSYADWRGFVPKGGRWA